MNFNLLSTLTIAAALLATPSFAAEVSNMHFVAQEETNWCWAASTQIVVQHNTGQNVRQCSMASRWVSNASNDICCSADYASSSYCNQGYVPETSLDYYGVLDQQSSVPLPQARLVQEVTNGYPLVITVMWPQGGGHALTIYGASSYTSDSGQIDTVNIWDSAGNGDKVVVSRSQAEYYLGGTWTRTMTTKCPGNKCPS